MISAGKQRVVGQVCRNVFLHRIVTKAIACTRFRLHSRSRSQRPKQLPPAAPNVIQMTTQFYFHLETNVTIPPMSAAFYVLSFVLNMLTNWQINPKNGIILGICVHSCRIELQCSSQLFSTEIPHPINPDDTVISP